MSRWTIPLFISDLAVVAMRACVNDALCDSVCVWVTAEDGNVGRSVKYMFLDSTVHASRPHPMHIRLGTPSRLVVSALLD